MFRRPYAPVLLHLNLITVPVILAIILIASFLSAPILPLFSLPLFFLAFPRPSGFWPFNSGRNDRSWNLKLASLWNKLNQISVFFYVMLFIISEGSSSASEDGIYYEQSADEILNSVVEATRSGGLGVLQPQDILLLRHEDRIMWIQVAFTLKCINVLIEESN